MSIVLSASTFAVFCSSNHDATSDDFVKPTGWSQSPAQSSARLDQGLEEKTGMFMDPEPSVVPFMFSLFPPYALNRSHPAP